MPGRRIDVVASAPPASDPYDPALGAWLFAGALAARGHRVRVLHPAGGSTGGPPTGVEAIPVPIVPKRPGSYEDEVAIASGIGPHLDPDVDLVIRDPAGLGPIGGRRRGRRSPRVAVFARSARIREVTPPPGAPGAAGVRDRLGLWFDRRAVRRLERAALAEASVVFFEEEPLRDTLSREYAVPPGRFRRLPQPLPPDTDAISRERVRGDLKVPLDVPLVVAVEPPEGAVVGGTGSSLESYRRVRGFFPGARLALIGSSAAANSGVALVPERSLATVGRILRAADVALFPRTSENRDPVVLMALRAGCATIVSPHVRLPNAEAERAVRRAPTDDPGDIASVLAELLADPTARRTIAQEGRNYAADFDVDRVAGTLEQAALGAAG